MSLDDDLDDDVNYRNCPDCPWFAWTVRDNCPICNADLGDSDV
jgi:rRNA maturation protein Nop10